MADRQLIDRRFDSCDLRTDLLFQIRDAVGVLQGAREKGFAVFLQHLQGYLTLHPQLRFLFEFQTHTLQVSRNRAQLLHCPGNHQFLRFVLMNFNPSLHLLNVVVVLLDKLCFSIEMLDDLFLFEHLLHDIRHLLFHQRNLLVDMRARGSLRAHLNVHHLDHFSRFGNRFRVSLLLKLDLELFCSLLQKGKLFICFFPDIFLLRQLLLNQFH